MDRTGNLVTSPYLIEQLALETYQTRLKNRPIKKDLAGLKDDKEELCKLRLVKARKDTQTRSFKQMWLEVISRRLL